MGPTDLGLWGVSLWGDAAQASPQNPAGPMLNQFEL